MTFQKEQQKIALIALVSVLAVLIAYRFVAGGKPKTAPLTYRRGAVAESPVRQGLSSRAADADPLSFLLERRTGKFPGVVRDIFRMENTIPKPKPSTKSLATSTTPSLVLVKTPEEIAADTARAEAEAVRADLMKFQFLGYLTDKVSTLFLSKEGELFIVKSGDKIQKSYKVKEAKNNYMILLDTVTGVEVRLELSGGDMKQQASSPEPTPAQAPRQRRQRNPRPNEPDGVRPPD